MNTATLQQLRRTAAPVVVLVALTLPFWGVQSGASRDIVIDTFIFMMATIAWNIIGGFGGQVSFGHSIFFGVGAYCTVLLFAHQAINTYLALFLGCVVAAATGAALGAITLRLHGIYFSLASFSLTLTLALLATHFVSITGGSIGESVPFLHNAPAQFQFENRLWYYYLGLGGVVVFALVAWWVYRSRLGFFLRALRDDEPAARACGVPVRFAKIIALVLSAALTAVAGGFYVQSVGFIDPDSAFGQTTAVQIALLSFVGGVGTLWGPVVGAAIFIPLQQTLGGTFDISPGLNLIIYGALVLLVISIEPRGLVYLFASDGRLRRQFIRRKTIRNLGDARDVTVVPDATRSAPGDTTGTAVEDSETFAAETVDDIQRLAASAQAQPARALGPTLLSLHEVSVQFGGLRAVDAVSLEVATGELFGIIGPNGAGKTTLFNTIAGAQGPTAGHITLSGQRISRRPPERVARRGVGRTFQNVRLFPRMTVRENLIVAAATGAGLAEARRRAAEILDLLELGEVADRRPRELPLATQKLTEIGRALALRPNLLLLDEMMSGLNEVEMGRLLQAIKRLNDDGLTIVVIEHVLRVIFDLTTRVAVLDHGALIAQGAPDDVMSQQHVVEAYLGKRAVKALDHD